MEIPILKISNLNYSYNGENFVLKNINLDIFKNEKIAVLGSNGSGKSTFFLNINGVLTPENGKIYYYNKEMTKKNINELRKNIGVIFQDPDNQIIASTVLSEVSFGPMNLKLPKDEVIKRVDEALSYMNITEFKNKAPHYLSGGEKKRVSIADIIAMKPEIIIFDEPTASLDYLNIKMLEEVLLKLSNEKKTILISTHDIDFAYKWAERIIIFYKGSIIADDKPINIFKNLEVLEKANLKKPIILDIYETIVKNNLIKEREIPRNIDELKLILSKI